uniref:Metal ABC transporter ATP-binding protein n=1 Tax=Dictyoglomus thermophilum TaxID=14 RepID=A0A7C3MIR2_DICTH
MNKIIEIKNLTFYYNNDKILDNINLEVDEGEFLGIIGPNGAGKSTLLKLIVGILKPQQGKIILFGKEIDNITYEKKFVGYVPQKPDIEKYLPLKVKDIVAFGRRIVRDWKALNKEDHEIINKIMEKLEIKEYADKIFSELSGGQQQRVLIARALVQNPKILLLDEPTVGVDIKTQYNFYRILEELKNQKISIILVTHDIGAITNKVDKLACLNRKLYIHGCPEEIKIHGALREIYGEEFIYLTHKED